MYPEFMDPMFQYGVQIGTGITDFFNALLGTTMGILEVLLLPFKILFYGLYFAFSSVSVVLTVLSGSFIPDIVLGGAFTVLLVSIIKMFM